MYGRMIGVMTFGGSLEQSSGPRSAVRSSGGPMGRKRSGTSALSVTRNSPELLRCEIERWSYLGKPPRPIKTTYCSVRLRENYSSRSIIPYFQAMPQRSIFLPPRRKALERRTRGSLLMPKQNQTARTKGQQATWNIGAHRPSDLELFISGSLKRCKLEIYRQ